MTKTELTQALKAGKTLDELFECVPGDECEIFKESRFLSGEDIIYIPDMMLNHIDISHSITDAEDIEDILQCCYTGNEFVEMCEGNERKAERLFWSCNWEHPSSALDDLDNEPEDVVYYCEKLGWSVDLDEDDGIAELRQYSPAGEDFSFTARCGDLKEFVSDVEDYADNFDTDEHVRLLLNAKAHGFAGVPTARELVDDAEAIFDMLDNLAYTLRTELL